MPKKQARRFQEIRLVSLRRVQNLNRNGMHTSNLVLEAGSAFSLKNARLDINAYAFQTKILYPKFMTLVDCTLKSFVLI